MTEPVHQGTAVGLPGDGPGSMASFGQRAVARVLDLTVAVAIAVITLVASSLVLGPENDSGQHLWILLVPLVAYAAYEVSSVALRGQTLGKAATRIRVVRIGSAELPGWGRSALRWGLPAVLFLIPIAASPAGLIPYLSAFLDPNRRGLHDKISGTVVVRAA